MMKPVSNWSLAAAAAIVIVLLSQSVEQCLAQSACTDSVNNNAPAVLQNSTGVLSGDLQLLFPAWRLNEMGYFYLWEAVVQGNATTSAIEFQIFRPHPKKKGVYNLIYGNRYDEALPGHSQTGNSISMEVDRNLHPLEIPVNPGYVVGIRLRSSDSIPAVKSNLGLQYSNTTSGAGGVDVYYWEGMGNQTCNLSVFDPNAGVLHGVIPLVSWRFCVKKSLIVENINFRFFLDVHPLVCSQVTFPEQTSVNPSPTPQLSSLPPSPFTASSGGSPSSIPTPVPSQFPPQQSSFINSPHPSATTFSTQLPTPTVLDITKSPPTQVTSSTTTIAIISVTIILFIITVILMIIIVLFFFHNFVRKRTRVARISVIPGIETIQSLQNSPIVQVKVPQQPPPFTETLEISSEDGSKE